MCPNDGGVFGIRVKAHAAQTAPPDVARAQIAYWGNGKGGEPVGTDQGATPTRAIDRRQAPSDANNATTAAWGSI